jgi:hypothetical protein
MLNYGCVNLFCNVWVFYSCVRVLVICVLNGMYCVLYCFTVFCIVLLCSVLFVLCSVLFYCVLYCFTVFCVVLLCSVLFVLCFCIVSFIYSICFVCTSVRTTATE